MTDRQEPGLGQEPQGTPPAPDPDGASSVHEFATITLDTEGKIAIPSYTDPETERLSQEFDPTTFKGHRLSHYAEIWRERNLAPIVGLGKVVGTYVGVAREDLPKIYEWAHGEGRFMQREDLTDIRVAKFGDREICFPTEKLLNAFGVQKRLTPAGTK